MFINRLALFRNNDYMIILSSTGKKYRTIQILNESVFRGSQYRIIFDQFKLLTKIKKSNLNRIYENDVIFFYVNKTSSCLKI